MIAESLPFQAWVDEMRERAIEANPELSEIWPKVAAHAVAVLAERGDIPGPNDSAEAQGVIAEAVRRANADPVPVNWAFNRNAVVSQIRAKIQTGEMTDAEGQELAEKLGYSLHGGAVQGRKPTMQDAREVAARLGYYR